MITVLVIDDLYAEQVRHTYRVKPEPVMPVYSNANTYSTAPETNCCYSTLDCITKQLAQESEEEALERQAQEYRRRNLSYLYRPKLIPRLLFILRVPPIVFQPCWSSRRWKSLT